MFTLKLTFIEIFIAIQQNLDFDSYLTPIWPLIWWGQKGVTWSQSFLCLLYLAHYHWNYFFPHWMMFWLLKLVLWPPLPVGISFNPLLGSKWPQSKFFSLGFMFTLKLTFMQIFIAIEQNLDFDPYLTPIWPLIWWGQRVVTWSESFLCFLFLHTIIETIFFPIGWCFSYWSWSCDHLYL